MNTQIQEVLKKSIETLKSCKHLEDTDKVILSLGDYKKLVNACKEALEAEQVCQAQKPVGYTAQWCIEYVAEYHIHEHTPTAEFWYKKGNSNEVALYTHPAQPWQGLTDDEIARLVLINEVDKSGDTGFARLIEQALRERNT
jgi:hypothetical protein